MSEPERVKGEGRRMNAEILNCKKENTSMEGDFPKQLLVQVVDREDQEPIRSAFSDLEEAQEDAENDGDVAIYQLVGVKHLKVTRELK